MGLGSSSCPTHLSRLLSLSPEVSFFKATPLFFSKPHGGTPQPLGHFPSLTEDFWPTHRLPLLPHVCRHLSQRLRICKDELFNELFYLPLGFSHCLCDFSMAIFIQNYQLWCFPIALGLWDLSPAPKVPPSSISRATANTQSSSSGLQGFPLI